MMDLIDKRRVAESFSKAASTYDSVAALQRDIGQTLLERMPHTQGSVVRLLDLGCGTGYFTAALAQRFNPNHLIGLDIASGMLAFAKGERQLNGVSWLCGDAESIPLRSEACDLIFSSLAIQWCEHIDLLFSEISRVLSQNGRAYIATLGPKTLYELRDAWSAVDDYQHVNRFVDKESLLAALPEDLTLSAVAVEDRVLQYQQLKELTAELKSLGAHNLNEGRPKGLTGGARIKAFKAAYESFRTDGGYLPATYEVYYLELRKH